MASLQNPSAWRHRLPAFALAAAGAAISTYLALFQYHIISTVWDPIFDGESVRVLNYGVLRPLGRALGLPLHDALLGAAAYAIEALLAVAGKANRSRTHPWLVAAYAVVVAGLGLSAAALVTMQGIVVHAWCTLCLVSAALSLAIVVISRHEIAAAAGFLGGCDARRRSSAKASDAA